MNNKWVRGSGRLAVIAGLSLVLQAFTAHLNASEPDSPYDHNYFSMQHLEWPPMPVPPVEGLQMYALTNGWLMNDLEVNYVELQEQYDAQLALELALGLLGSRSGSGTAGPLFAGSCTGHLLPPVYQVTNVVLRLTNYASGDQYDLFTVTDITVTNWTYLGRWTNAAASWTVTNPPAFDSFYTVGCIDDNDVTGGDGLSDVFEALVSHTDPSDPDTDYDGRSDYEEYILEGTNPLDPSSFTPVRLAFFRFNDTNWLGDRAQAPLLATNLQSVDAWITKAVQLTNPAASLKYRTVEPDGKANINLRSGTIRFWFKPLWNSGTGTGAAAKLIEVGSKGASTTNGWWSLFLNSAGNTFIFASQTNNMAETTNLTAAVSFVSNNWYQIVLTYTNGAFALYTNGVLCATNTGPLTWPNLAQRANGFTIGCATDGDSVANGVFEDLETFNYPLNPNDILENFQLTEPPMLIPNLLMWLKADANVQTNGTRVAQWNDQSGNSNNAIQLSVPSQPFLTNNGISSKPSLYFPGTNNFFTLPPSLSNGVSELEGFVVLQADSAMPAVNKGLWRMGSQGSLYPSSGGNIADSFGSGSSQRTFAPPEIPLTQPHIYNAASRSNEWSCRFDGIVHFSQSNNVFQLSPPFYLGNGSGDYFAGNIGEVMFFSRVLTGTERFAIESYLGQRFNLVTNPPAAAGGLTAFAVSTNQISLTWSNALSGTNTGFLIQRRTGLETYKDIALVRNGLSYLDTDLATATQYYYRIKTVNYSGVSALSAETNATTLSTGITIPLASLTLWLKADTGHGSGAVNCWVDQTTNNNSAYFTDSRASAAPRWAGFNTNGHPVVSFFGTNAFELPAFLASASQAEAFVVVRSFGSTSSNWASLWWMSSDSLDSRYPYTNNFVWDNFGRTSSSVQFDSGLANFSTMHLYNPMSKSGQWSAAFNNGARYVNNTNTPGFPPTYSLLGRGASTVSEFMHGEMSEVLIFNRELTQWERDVVSTNYLNKRFNLW